MDVAKVYAGKAQVFLKTHELTISRVGQVVSALILFSALVSLGCICQEMSDAVRGGYVYAQGVGKSFTESYNDALGTAMVAAIIGILFLVHHHVRSRKSAFEVVDMHEPRVDQIQGLVEEQSVN